MFRRMGGIFHNHRKGRSARYESNAGVEGTSSGPIEVTTFPKIHHDHPVGCVAPVKENVCVSGGQDKRMIVFNYATGRVTENWQLHDKEITKVICAPKLPGYFSASRDKTVIMYKDNVPAPIQRFIGHSLLVSGLTINPEQTTLCTGSRDNSLRLWSIETGQCTSIESISRNLISHVHWAPSADLIAQCGEDKEVRIFDSRNLMLVKAFQKKLYIQTWCDISEDSRYCLSASNGFGGQGCEATLWDIGSGRIIHEFKGHNETICCCRFVPSSSLNSSRPIIATSSQDCSVRLWDRDSRACLDLLTFPGSGPLTSISTQPEGNLVVSSFNTGIHVVRLRSDGSGVAMQTAAQF